MASRWKLRGLMAIQFARRLWDRANQDELFTRSAALSYYFFSALVPALFFLTALLGIFASQSEHLRTDLLNYFAQIMPSTAFTLVAKTLQEISNSSTGLNLERALYLYAASRDNPSGGVAPCWR